MPAVLLPKPATHRPATKRAGGQRSGARPIKIEEEIAILVQRNAKLLDNEYYSKVSDLLGLGRRLG